MSCFIVLYCCYLRLLVLIVGLCCFDCGGFWFVFDYRVCDLEALVLVAWYCFCWFMGACDCLTWVLAD